MARGRGWWRSAVRGPPPVGQGGAPGWDARRETLTAPIRSSSAAVRLQPSTQPCSGASTTGCDREGNWCSPPERLRSGSMPLAPRPPSGCRGRLQNWCPCVGATRSRPTHGPTARSRRPPLPGWKCRSSKHRRRSREVSRRSKVVGRPIFRWSCGGPTVWEPSCGRALTSISHPFATGPGASRCWWKCCVAVGQGRTRAAQVKPIVRRWIWPANSARRLTCFRVWLRFRSR